MNITIVAWGGHGDIRPYVALALGLKKAGHLIRFITTPYQEEFVSSYGFPLKTIDCSYSPSVLPKPSDWPEWTHVTGYWYLDHSVDWQPPADIVEFLAAGSPPVYIEIRHSEVTKEMILDVLKQTGQRAVVRGMGFDETDVSDLADQVFPVDSIPHDWLFPQMAAIVHHGGTGTTMSSLRAGVPTVIVPLEGDQFLWAYKVPKLGLGPKPILQKQISAASIAKAIKIAVNDKNMQVKAAAMGEKLRAENGVNSAITILHDYFQSHT